MPRTTFSVVEYHRLADSTILHIGLPTEKTVVDTHSPLSLPFGEMLELFFVSV